MGRNESSDRRGLKTDRIRLHQRNSALAAIGAVIIALAPDWMKAILVKRDLVLEEVNVTGQDELDDDGEKKCFHLLV